VDLTPEQVLAKLQEAEAKLQESQTKLEALERTKTGLLNDLTKRKSVERLVKAVGIDLEADNLEDQVAEVLGKRPAPPAPATPPAAHPSGDGANPDPAASGSNSNEEALKARLATMERMLEKVSDKLQQTEKEKQQERKARLEEYQRSVVVQELEKVGCKRPHHLYELQKRNFRILEGPDGTHEVVYGPEENPVNVAGAVSDFEKDDEYSIYFPSIVASGSGLPTSRSSMPASSNPFTKTGSNGTEASRIMASDMALARKLVREARGRGDFDPILCGTVDKR
jgi:hypothetical protein